MMHFRNLVENILTHCGYDVSKLEVEVALNEPIQIAAETLEKYADPQMQPTYKLNVPSSGKVRQRRSSGAAAGLHSGDGLSCSGNCFLSVFPAHFHSGQHPDYGA